MTTRAIPTTYGGVRYRSRTEARWAMFFDAANIWADYEPQGFMLAGKPYLPDFFVHDFGAFLEIKGSAPTEDEAARCAALSSIGWPVLLAIGAPAEKFQILRFEEGGDLPGLYALAQDCYVAAGFWLVGEEDAVCMGEPGMRRGGPLFSGVIQDASRLARSSRFVDSRRVPAMEHHPDRLWTP